MRARKKVNNERLTEKEEEEEEQEEEGGEEEEEELNCIAQIHYKIIQPMNKNTDICFLVIDRQL